MVLLTEAQAHLAASSKEMAAAIAQVGTTKIRAAEGEPFSELARSIVFQKLATSAATAIHGRTVEALGGVMTPAGIIEHLVTVRGIGRWTAEMFLIFTLRSGDVWPVGDLAVRAGYARIFGLPAPPIQKELMILGEPFRPYRTTAAWYCWQASRFPA